MAAKKLNPNQIRNKREIELYLQMLKDSLKGFEVADLSVDSNYNLHTVKDGKEIIKFVDLPDEIKLAILPSYRKPDEQENEFENISNNEGDENEFENLNKFIFPDFWDYEKEPVIIGEFLGEGRTVGEGKKETQTYLFWNHKNQKPFCVPQWGGIKSFFENPNKFIPKRNYRLQYMGMGENENGKFHKVDIERGKADLKNPYSGKDIDKMTCEYKK